MFSQISEGLMVRRVFGMCQLFPVRLMGDVRDMDAGMYHSLFLKTDGSPWGWGSNVSGILGEQTIKLQRTVPVRIVLPEN